MRQQIDVTDTLLRLFCYAGEHRRIVFTQARNAGRFEELRGVGEPSDHRAVRRLHRIQSQLELSSLLADPILPQLQIGQLSQAAIVDLQVIHDYAKQRTLRKVAIRLECFDQLLERQILVCLGLSHRFD